MKKRPWFVYILSCCDNTFYTGISNRVEERIKIHNNGKGAKYTKIKRPVTLVYQEKYKNRSTAQKREIAIKSWPRKKKEKLVAGLLDPHKTRNKSLVRLLERRPSGRASPLAGSELQPTIVGSIRTLPAGAGSRRAGKAELPYYAQVKIYNA